MQNTDLTEKVTQMHNLKRLSKVSLLYFLFVLLAGCQTMDSNFSAFLQNQPEFGLSETVVLPRDHRQIDGKSTVENMVRNAIHLAKKKRFSESRNIFQEVKDIQFRGSKGHQSITDAMARVTLKQGDLPAFRRLGGELDMSLGKPLRVPTKHIPVICLARALSREALPINAPEKFVRFRDTYLPIDKKLS